MADHDAELQELRAYLRPHLERWLQEALATGCPKEALACQRVRQALTDPVSIFKLALLMLHLGWCARESEIDQPRPSTAEWFAALAKTAEATMNRTGPKPISVGLVGKLVSEGLKGDGLMLELRHRTGRSERTARRAMAAWRALEKGDGLICIIELDEDGQIVITFPPRSGVSS